MGRLVAARVCLNPMGYVYCFRVGKDDCFKVGRTKSAPERRLRSVSVGSSQKLTLHRKLETDDAPRLEKHPHWLLDSGRAPNGEFFNVSDADLDAAIETANAFVTGSAPARRDAKKLRRVKPVGQMVEPSAKALSLHRALRT